MNDIQWQVFAYIVSKVETPLMSAVASVMNAFSWCHNRSPARRWRPCGAGRG